MIPNKKHFEDTVAGRGLLQRRAHLAEGRKFRRKSLPDEFSISKFACESLQRPVAFLQRPVRIRNQCKFSGG
jgi:hypothetical protein